MNLYASVLTCKPANSYISKLAYFLQSYSLISYLFSLVWVLMLTYADLFSDPILTSNETDLMGNSSDLESEKVHHHGLGVGDDLH